MKVDTKQRKKARKGFAQVYGNEELAAQNGSCPPDRQEGIGFARHGARAHARGDDHGHGAGGALRPRRQAPPEGVYKWAYQKGSIYCGDQKVRVNHPRLRGPEGEIALSTLRNPETAGRLLGGAPRESPSRHIGQTIRRDRHRYRIRLRRLCFLRLPALHRGHRQKAQGVQGKGPLRYLRLRRLHRHRPSGQGRLHGRPGNRRDGP